MKKIKQVAKEAALALVFEDVNKLPMIEVNVSAKGKKQNTGLYSIKVPKAFINEVYSIGLKDGFEMYIENGRVL